MLLLLVLWSMSIYADNEFGDYATKQYSIIPPSPEVASLMKYIDVPVSHFTGQPQIELPIYTLTEGSLSVPISLSYKGGGIKQNELPGIISKGWNLNAGVTISRTVHGLPDECNYNAGTSKHLRGLFYLDTLNIRLRNAVINKLDNLEIPYSPNNINAFNHQECSNYEKGYIDFANDIFQFYGLGMNGTFIYDIGKNMTLSTNSPIEFTKKNNNINDVFEITDKDKTIYTFDELGVENTWSPINAEGYNLGEFNSDSLFYRSAWHITKMESVYGDVINFEYSAPIYRNEYNGYSQYYIFNTGSESFESRTNTSVDRHRYMERNLTSIKSKSTIVKFHYGTNNKYLDSITIHRANNEKILHYEIVRSNNGNMETIKQISGTKEQPLYKFVYADKTCYEPFSIDHWGYCNGAQNSSLLPDIGYSTLTYGKANREPNESYMKQGILTKIMYPMGGSTSFTWEENDYSYSVKDDENSSHDNIASNQSVNVYLIDVLSPGGSKLKSTGSFYVKRNDYIKVNLSTYFGSLTDVGAPFFNRGNFYQEYTYDEHNINYPCVKVVKLGEDGINTDVDTFYIDKNCKTDSVRYVGATEGYYYVKLCNTDPENFMDAEDVYKEFYMTEIGGTKTYGYITVTFPNYTEPALNVKYWGGLRIASITSSPLEGNPITKTFSYKKLENNLSSGVILKYPKYDYNTCCYKDLTEMPGANNTENICITSNGLPRSTDGELNIEYSEIWETYSGSVNYKVGYFYDTQKLYYDRSNCLYEGMVPEGMKTLTSYAFKRGHLKEKRYINKENNMYKKEIYNYNILEKTATPIFTGPLHTLCDFTELNQGQKSKDYTINKYTLIPYNKRIVEETIWEKHTITEGEIESENTISYTYYGDGYSSKPWNSFVRSKSYVNSRGQNVTIYNTYYKVGNVPLDLKELEIMVVNDIVISARRNEYGTNHKLAKTYTGCVGMQFSSNFNLPDNILDDASYPAIGKEEYSYMYDSKGNIVQISYNGKVLASYLWGYMGKHPILEAQGVSYADLLQIAKSTNKYNEENYVNESNLQSLFSTIRSSFPNKNIMTYTYHWLLGMATSSDSRNVTNTYMLDGFGRLTGIKDTNGYFISKYDYNYKGF